MHASAASRHDKYRIPYMKTRVAIMNQYRLAFAALVLALPHNLDAHCPTGTGIHNN